MLLKCTSCQHSQAEVRRSIKLANFLAWFSCQRQSADEIVEHVTCHVSDDKKIADDKDANAFMVLYFLTAKQHNKWTIRVRHWLIDRSVICWSYISSADCLWKLNHAPKVGQLYRSFDVGFSRLGATQMTAKCVLEVSNTVKQHLG